MKRSWIKIFSILLFSMLFFNFQCTNFYKENYCRHLKQSADQQLIGTWQANYDIDSCQYLQITFNEDFTGTINYFNSSGKQILTSPCLFAWKTYVDKYYFYFSSNFRVYLTIYRLNQNCAICDFDQEGKIPDTTTYVINQITDTTLVLELISRNKYQITQNDLLNCKISSFFAPCQRKLVRVNY